MIPDYAQTESIYSSQVNRLQRITNILSFLRLIALIFCAFFIYQNSNHPNNAYLLLIFCFGVFFIYFIAIHNRYKKKLVVAKTFVWVNQSEFNFIQNNQPYYPNGAEFNTDNHPFANDIDLFGNHSLFEYLNRTSTVLGATKLAESLSGVVSKSELQERQKAIDELSSQFEWSQAFQVHAKLGQDNPKTLSLIHQWKEKSNNIHPFLIVSSFIFPILGATTMLMLGYTGEVSWFNYGVVLFLINLISFGVIHKQIKAEIEQLDTIGASFKAYGKLLELITENKWQSTYLINIQKSITESKISAPMALKQAGRIYNNLESVQNGLAVMLLNGTLQYHVHIFKQLIQWKKQYQSDVPKWIQIIGEMESLLSLARFKSNNPSFVFPKIGDSIQFEKLEHPLINPKKRVANSIDFSEQSIVILTGSNMSGKSTFLRTIGSAIALANAGSVVPATTATFYPIQLLASVRLTDSLSENSSYFFSEVTRLKTIMTFLETNEAFVLLDEILRGTNSEDKIAGTIGVIEKLTAKNASGIIATHDLEVCKLEQKYPSKIANNCFEATITNNELTFDYQLRNGICKNKSATFIMIQNNII